MKNCLPFLSFIAVKVEKWKIHNIPPTNVKTVIRNKNPIPKPREPHQNGKRHWKNIFPETHAPMFTKRYVKFPWQKHTVFWLTFGILRARKTVHENRCLIEHPYSSSFTYSIKSAGWHSKREQIVSNVFHDTNSPCRNCCK